MPQINLSLWYAISFFLVILSFGYITVEILFGKKYLFRDRIDASKTPLFDKLMHYVIWWFIINTIIFFLLPYSPFIKEIVWKIISWGLEIGQKINPENYIEISITISSFLYFFVFIFLVTFEYTIIAGLTFLIFLIKKIIHKFDTIKSIRNCFIQCIKEKN